MTLDVDGVSLEEAAAGLAGTTPAEPEATESTSAAESDDAKLELPSGESLEAIPDGPPDEAEAKEAISRSPQLQKIIDSKYGGDEEKFVAALFEGWNSSSRLAKEIEELKNKLTEVTEEIPEPPAPIEHPDMARLDERIRALDAKQQSVLQTRNTILANIAKSREDQAELRGEIKRSSEDDRYRLEEKLERAQAKEQAEVERWHGLGDKLEDLTEQRRTVEGQKRIAEQQLSAYKAEQQRQGLELVEFRKRTVQDFNQAVEEEFKAYGVEAEKLKSHMWRTIKAQATDYLRSLPPGNPIDLKAFVKNAAKDYSEVMNLGKNQEFRDKTEQKLQAAAKATGQKLPQPQPQTPPAKEPAKSNKPWTAEFARARAAKVLG